MHKPIFLKKISLSFTEKNCFEDFSSQIYPGSRIGIIGRNGCGKSSLLNILRKKMSPSSGDVIIPDDLSIGYVEQTITDFNDLSGGQRFNKKLSMALSLSPDTLLLDEPTNHLDRDNRKSLMRMLRSYQGTLIVVTHDTELLRNCVDRIWHIDNNKISEFSGTYDDYINTIKQKRSSIEKELSSLNRQKKEVHSALMQQQERVAKSRAQGKKKVATRKWMKMVGDLKGMKAEKSQGKQLTAIEKSKSDLRNKLSEIRLPEILFPKFSLTPADVSDSNILSISSASLAYSDDEVVLKNINLTLTGQERISVCGKNASGKSTLLKAILGHQIIKTGSWFLPRAEYIGYLDQHYSNLSTQDSVLDHIIQARPDWSISEVRRHLNDFLFRKNEQVLQLVANLSGGEKAMLSLSLIAAKTPKLLILDEITNNIDLETKEYIVQVLSKYPGAMIFVSHEEDFVQVVGVDHYYKIFDGSLIRA